MTQRQPFTPGKIKIALGPNGEREKFTTLKAFAQAHGFNDKSISTSLKERGHYKGWRVIEEGDDAFPTIAAGDPPAIVREKLRQYIGWVQSKDAEYALYPDSRPEGWNAVNLGKVAQEVAKANNIDWEDVGDTRDEGDKVLDAALQFVQTPEDVFAMLEAQIEALSKGMERIEKESHEVARMLDERAKSMGKAGPPTDPKALAGRAKRWKALLRKILWLRRLARDEFIPEIGGRWPEHLQRATHTVRFMLYVGRSDITTKNPADEIYKIGTPQVRMAMEPWFAENGWEMRSGVGLTSPDDINPETGEPYGFTKWVGAIVEAPPRHSKTDSVILRRVLRINKEPKRQAAYVHDSDEFASSRLLAIRRYFNPDTAQGRRNMSLFGQRLADTGNNKNYLTIKTDSPTTNPSLAAHGIDTSRTGINLDDLDGDDLVPQSDIFQPTEREWRLTTWDRTWMTRFQGHRGFLLLTGYPQHQDDLLSYYERQAALCQATGGREGIKLWVCKMPVGGPDSDPPFYPVFPELYDQAFLAAKYASLTDKSTWASNYMLQPMDERDRIVRELRLYDENSDEHRRFMSSAEIYIGVDPAIKGDGTGDKAGVVIVALGEVVNIDETPGLGMVSSSEWQIRVVQEMEFHATQHELNEHLLTMGMQWNVSRVFVEAIDGGGSAMVEAMRNYYGVAAVEPYRPHGHHDKAMRLRAVAALLENSNKAYPAKAMFPARMVDLDDGTRAAVLDERMNRLANYILNFATTSGHHSLDGLTIVLSKLTPRVNVGLAPFSKQVQNERPGGSSRIRDMLQQKRLEPSRQSDLRSVITSMGA